MTVAEAIMAEAYDRGLRHFFGIPGGGAPLDLIEAGRTTLIDARVDPGPYQDSFGLSIGVLN